MNACVERHATTARLPRASSSPMAFSKCVFPSPLFPTNTSGLYFFPGRSRAARAALAATWFDGPTAKATSGNAADGPGGGPAPSRTLAAACSASLTRSGSRNTLCPAACGSNSATSASSALSRSTSAANSAIALSTPPGASRCSSASSRCVRYPSPSHRSTASTLRGSGRTPIARLGGPFGHQAEDLLRRLRVDLRVVHRLKRHQPVQRAHQLAHVADLRLRHRLQHARLEPRAALVGLASQNRHPRLA